MAEAGFEAPVVPRFAASTGSSERASARHSEALSYRPDIDGLRAIAVTLVILVHAFPDALQNGFVGVDIFFVISGYLITGILLAQLKRGALDLADFYVRRANRIFPALIVTLAACVGFGWIALYANEFRLLGRSVATGAGFVANIGAYFESGYWDTGAKLKPLLHLWSLGVEEQFYLVWPLLLATAWVWRRTGIVLLVLSGLSLALGLWLTDVDQAAAFYLPFGRICELGAGAGLAYVEMRSGAAPAQAPGSDVAAFAGMAMIVLVIAQRFPVSEFPGPHAILPVVGTVLIISAGRGAWLNRHVLSHPAIVYVGLISFPLYLAHWPALSFARILNNGDLPDAFRNGALALTIVLAVATYHFIERPVRAHRSSRRRIAIGAAILLACCGGTGYAIYLKDGLSSRYGLAQEPAHWPSVPTRAKIALIGDSFAGILDAPLRKMYRERFIGQAAPSWPFLSGVGYKPGIKPLYWKATPDETNKLLAEITSDRAISVVVIAHASNPYIDNDNLRSYPVSPPGETSVAAYEAGLRRTVRMLTDAGKRVIYVKSNPLLWAVPLVEVCSSATLPVPRRHPADCVIPVDVVRQRAQIYNDAVYRALVGMDGVTVIDPAPLLLCDQRFCYVERDGALMYRDPGHLSPIACQVLAYVIAKVIEE